MKYPHTYFHHLYKSLLPGACLLFASHAHAATVGFVESLQFDESGSKPFHCTKAAVPSPDDKYVYSSGYCDHALNVFSRDPVSGKLTLVSSLIGNQKTGEGLSFIESVVMHPNGKYVFAYGTSGSSSSKTNPFHDTIFAYERNATTGLLTFLSELKDPAINGNWNMHVSSDGHYLYAGSQSGVAVIQISGNGILTLSQKLDKTSKLGTSSYGQSVNIRPDNKYLYLITGNNTIAWFQRDPISGVLTYGGEIQPKGTDMVSGLTGFGAMGMSSDGKDLYALIEHNDSHKTFIFHFAVADDGPLSLIGEPVKAPIGDDFYCPSNVIVSPNNKLVYLVDGCADHFQTWLRDTTTGGLTFLGADEEDSGKNDIPRQAFSQVNNIGFSSDGRFAILAVNAGITTLNLTADIALTSSFSPNVIVKDVYNGVITLTNQGPADAHDIEVTLTGNALLGAKSVSVSLPQGSCSQTADTAVCKLPKLPGKAVETIDLKLQAPEALQPLQINVTKTQAEIDPDTQTDSLQITVQPVVTAASSSVQSSSAQASSVQSSSTQASSASQSSSQQPLPDPAPAPKSSKGGGSIGFEWLLLLSILWFFRKSQQERLSS